MKRRKVRWILKKKKDKNSIPEPVKEKPVPEIPTPNQVGLKEGVPPN